MTKVSRIPSESASSGDKKVDLHFQLIWKNMDLSTKRTFLKMAIEFRQQGGAKFG